MSGKDNVWKTITLVLVAMLVATAMMTLVFYGQLATSEERYRSTVASLDSISYSLDILFNFGNSTKVWHNDTRIPLGFNLYNATMLATRGDLKSTYYPQYQTHFMNSIEGVGGDSSKPSWAWMTWHFNESTGKWETYDIGADMVTLKSTNKVAWFYQDTSKYPDLAQPN